MMKIEGKGNTIDVKQQDGSTYEFTYVPYNCDNSDCPEFLLVKSHDMKLGKPRAPATINTYNRADIEEYEEPEEEE